MRTRTLLRFVLVAIPTLGLMLLWLSILPRQGQAAAAADQCGLNPTPTPTPFGRGYGQGRPAPAFVPTPDPRWVELVRTGSLSGHAPAVPAMTVNLNLTDQFVAGRVPTGAQVDITVSYQGQVIDRNSVFPVFDGYGFFYTSYVYAGAYGTIPPGCVLQVTQGGTTISMTVPTLTSLAYPQTDILSGTAPADAALTAYLFPFNQPGQMYTATATASAAGTYQITWAPGIDLRPQDSGFLLYTQDSARMVSLRFVAPLLRVQAGGPGISGVAAPNQSLSIVVEDALGQGPYYFNTYSLERGIFDTQACWNVNDETRCISFSPGDRVIVSAGGQTFSTTVVAITAQADRQAGQVTGQAPPSQPVEVRRLRGPIGDWNFDLWYQDPLDRVVVTATAQGGYALSLPLQAGNYGAAAVTTSEGSLVYVRYSVPYMDAMLGRPPLYEFGYVRMWGNVDEVNAPITVEVQGPSGYLKDWYTLVSTDNGYFLDQPNYDASLFLESGDRITLTTSQGPQISLLLPVLTAAADNATQVVSGQAPPLSQVVVTTGGGYLPPYYTRALTVTADVNGQYSADFSSLGGFGEGSIGNVAWTSPEGYTVERPFALMLANQCPVRLGSAQVGGNEVWLSGGFKCDPYTLRLRGADRTIKFESDFYAYVDTVKFTDQDGNPIFITPGDQLELESNGQQENSIVPVLTVSLDPQADRVSGQAPPSAVVELVSSGLDITVTASSQGLYSHNLSGVFDVQPGSYFQALLGSQPRYFAYGAVPVLIATLYSSGVSGRLAPFTPYTVTLSTPITVTAFYTGVSGNTGEFRSSFYPPPGQEAQVLPGDRLQVKTPTRLWDVILPLLTAQVNAATGVVSGQAPPGSRLDVSLSTRAGYQYSATITATVRGDYSTTFLVPADVESLAGTVSQYTTQDIRTRLDFSTPYWSVTLGSVYVSGRAPMDGAPITLILRSGDGAFTQVVTGTNTMQDSYFNVKFTRPIQPGDHLTLETSSGLLNEFTVPYLSAAYDYVRHVLEGRAPPGGDLYAYFPGMLGSSGRHIRLMPDGRYGVDASDLNPHVGAWGDVYFTDRFGNHVECLFMIRGYPQFLPVIRLKAAFP